MTAVTMDAVIAGIQYPETRRLLANAVNAVLVEETQRKRAEAERLAKAKAERQAVYMAVAAECTALVPESLRRYVQKDPEGEIGLVRGEGDTFSLDLCLPGVRVGLRVVFVAHLTMDGKAGWKRAHYLVPGIVEGYELAPGGRRVVTLTWDKGQALEASSRDDALYWLVRQTAEFENALAEAEAWNREIGGGNG